ncbi:hypothetical protein [Nostoc sp. UHCC 0870]|uniref:hypothetical protein n=2 Tax=Nostoc sp. UHCC 0870 TaxID=2914041 RepID=UPI0030DB0F01
MILDASLTDATEVVLLRLCVRLESWQCPIPTLFIFFAAFSSRSCSVPQCDMGIKAALEAINKAKITASEIDLIAYCAAGDYDYRFWSPAAKIQDAIGAERYRLGVGLGC